MRHTNTIKRLKKNLPHLSSLLCNFSLISKVRTNFYHLHLNLLKGGSGYVNLKVDYVLNQGSSLLNQGNDWRNQPCRSPPVWRLPSSSPPWWGNPAPPPPSSPRWCSRNLVVIVVVMFSKIPTQWTRLILYLCFSSDVSPGTCSCIGTVPLSPHETSWGRRRVPGTGTWFLQSAFRWKDSR